MLICALDIYRGHSPWLANNISQFGLNQGILLVLSPAFVGFILRYNLKRF